MVFQCLFHPPYVVLIVRIQGSQLFYHFLRLFSFFKESVFEFALAMGVRYLLFIILYLSVNLVSRRVTQFDTLIL